MFGEAQGSIHPRQGGSLAGYQISKAIIGLVHQVACGITAQGTTSFYSKNLTTVLV